MSPEALIIFPEHFDWFSTVRVDGVDQNSQRVNVALGRVIGDECTLRCHELEARLRQRVPRRVVFVERPVRLGIVWILIQDTIVEAEDLPGALLVDNDGLRANISMKKFHVSVKESETFTDLNQAILGVDVMELVSAETVRLWHVVVIPQNVCQTGKNRFRCESNRISALLEWMLNSQNVRMSYLCKLHCSPLQDIKKLLSIFLGKLFQLFLLKLKNRCFLLCGFLCCFVNSP